MRRNDPDWTKEQRRRENWYQDQWGQWTQQNWDREGGNEDKTVAKRQQETQWGTIQEQPQLPGEEEEQEAFGNQQWQQQWGENA